MTNLETSKIGCHYALINFLKSLVYNIYLLFIVQCWTQASKPEPLKQDTQKEKKK